MTDTLYKILNRPRWIRSSIQTKKEQIRDLELMMLPSGIRYDTDKVITSPSDQMVEFAAKVDELNRELDRLSDAYIEAYGKVESLIGGLEDQRHRDIMTLRYLVNVKFDDIPDRIGYSRSRMFDLYNDALKLLQDRTESD